MSDPSASPSTPTTSADREIYFTFPSGGRNIKAHPALVNLSGFLKDFLKSVDTESTGPVYIPSNNIGPDEIELLNQFVEHLDKKYPEAVRTEQDRKDYWMDFVPSHRDCLRPLCEKVDKDLLITSANAGDFLIIPAFISFCTYFLCERAQHMKLNELRDFLNEEADFDEEQMRIIRECPEFSNL